MSRTLNYFNYQESLFFYKIPYCLIILIPFFLISGPLLTDISISLCALIFLINSIKYKLKRFYNNFFFFILFLFYIILIISSISSNNPIISVKTSIFYIRFLIFSLSVWYIVSVNPKIINHLFYSISFAFTILIFDGYFQFFFEKNLFGMPMQGTRISSFFGSELILGSYISRLLPLLFACFIFLNKKNNYLVLFSLFIFIFAEILIFLSGERTAFFYLNFSILILIFLLNNYKKFRIISFLISMIIIIFLSFFNPKFKERIIDNTIHSFGFADKNKYINTQKKNDNSNFQNLHIFSIEHEALYKSGTLMFLDNKIIGIGPRLFRFECKNKDYYVNIFSCNNHPHNSYIQLLAETGILGFLIIFFIFIIITISFFKHFFYKLYKKKIIFNDFQIALMTSIFISLWPFIPTGNFFGNWLNAIYYLPLGFLLNSFKKDNFMVKKFIN